MCSAFEVGSGRALPLLLWARLSLPAVKPTDASAIGKEVVLSPTLLESLPGREREEPWRAASKSSLFLLSIGAVGRISKPASEHAQLWNGRSREIGQASEEYPVPCSRASLCTGAVVREEPLPLLPLSPGLWPRCSGGDGGSRTKTFGVLRPTPSMLDTCHGAALDWLPAMGALGKPCRWCAIPQHFCHLPLDRPCDGEEQDEDLVAPLKLATPGNPLRLPIEWTARALALRGY